MQENLIFDDDTIAKMITCPKEFKSRPREPMSVNKNISQRFSVFAADTGIEFSVFVTHSQMFPQDFSIGLMLQDYLLFRVNGFHGTTRRGFYSAEHHARPHTHTLTMDDIEAGRKAKPSLITDTSGDYVDLATARLYFFRHCGIMGYEKYFHDSQQLSMFD